MGKAVAFVVWVSLFGSGLSFLLHTGEWAALLEYARKKEQRSSLMMGFFTLLSGAFIVGFHWIWSGLSLVLTVIGILMIAKGLVCLCFPSLMPMMLQRLASDYRPLLRLSGILFIALSLFVLSEWLQYVRGIYDWQWLIGEEKR